MAIYQADKIFVDVDDEINFVVTKILETDKNRVILVVPQHALIISSQVSIKILAKQLLKSKKLLIFVCEDQFGTRIAQEAGLVVVKKVSDIMPENWEQVNLNRESLLAQAEAKKKKLLKERGIIDNSEPEIGDDSLVIAQEVERSDTEDSDENIEIADSEEVETEEVDQDEELVASSADDEIHSTEAPVELRGAIQRPRPEPKIAKLGKFTVIGAGDAAEILGSKHAIVEAPNFEDSNMDNNTLRTRTERVAELASSPAGRRGFTGRDWTSVTGSKVNPEPWWKKAWPFKKPLPKRTDADGTVTQSPRDWRKIGLIAAAAILGLVLLVFALIWWQFSSVDLKINLRTQQVPVEQQVEVDTAASVIDETTLTLPARLITDNSLSISGTAKATGKGSKGEKATGLIQFWNKKTEEVKLLKGTVVTNTTTNLNYILQADITLEAAKPDPDNPDVLILGGVGKEVSITAEKIGPTYNIETTSEQQDFKVAGYTTNEVIGKRFRKIEGGTSQEFVAVSTQDFEKLKQPLSDSLQTQGKNRLRSLVPAGYLLIPGTETLEITDAIATPDIAAEADEFSVSVEGVATALVVSEADLTKAIEILITRNQGDEDVASNFEVQGIADVEFTNVERTDDTAKFVLVSKGSLRSKLTEVEVLNNVIGKNISEVRRYLDDNNEIESYTLLFNPAIFPEALQFMPYVPERIHVRF